MAVKKYSVLIVDDEPDIVDSLYDTFIFKYNVFKAYSAQEALEVIRSNRIDLVISDQRMPEITGVELFEILEKEHPHIGKVLLTGYADIQSVVDAINKGNVDKYLSKPWVEDDILHIVLEVLSTRLKKAIEERKHADRQLIKASSLLRATLDSTHDGILVIDLKGKITHYNNRFQEMWGISDAIMDSKDDQKALDFAVNQLKDPESFLSKVKELYNNPSDKSMDIVELKDGRFFEQYSQPQKTENQVVGRVWTFHDITEIKRVEGQLLKSEYELSKALELSRSISMIAPNSHIISDSNGTILSINPSAEKTFGYKTEELVGENVSVLTPGHLYNEYSRSIQNYRDYKKSGKPDKRNVIRGPKESMAIRKNGEEFPISIYVREATVAGDRIFVGIIADITERKFEEERIKKADEYIRNLIECSMDMIISVDENRKIVEFNKAAEKAFGYKKEEIRGKDIEMLYANPDEAKAMPILLQGRENFSSEILNKRKNGEIFPSLATISLLKDSEGNRIGVMGVSRDITYQINVREELREAKEKAETANKAKDGFLANMSHEIRTPLNGIIGMAELLSDTDIKDDQLSFVRTLNIEANSLLSIVNNILDFSKIEAGKLQLEIINFDLNSLINDLANSFAYKAVQKGLEFNCFISPDIPSRLTGDPVRLRQVLVNLTDNALKFTQKGEVFVKAELSEEKGEIIKILFSVKDTGIGIAKDKQDHIFHSFSQADTSTTRKYGGTGLGTTISKELTKLLGGEIYLSSEEGRGSTFYFTAIFTKQTEQEKDNTEEKINLTGKKVLVVDDNKINRFVLSERLNHFGCVSVEAPGGKEALELLEKSLSSQKPFDLIITDYMMPEMDGFEFTRLIKERTSLEKIPIILLTSVGQVGDAKNCKNLGILGYATKPMREDYLKKVIESVFVSSTEALDDSNQNLVTKHTITEKNREKDIRILLAEDYPTNQQVAILHLQSAGYKVDLAENGRQAFEAYKKQPYEIIFMDIQMPEMDGLEATSKIRDHEKELKSLDPDLEIRAVIIAMTAHATSTDQKKCKDAGMDDFIAKPLRRSNFLAMADKWVSKINDSLSLPHSNESDKPSPEPVVPENQQSSTTIRKPSIGNRKSQEDAPINFNLAIDEFEGDKEYLMKVIEGFLKNVATQIKTTRQAISDGDAEIVRKEAHAIKGGAANLTADNLSCAALELENSAKAGNLTEVNKAIDRLEKEFHRLLDYVEGE